MLFRVVCRHADKALNLSRKNAEDERLPVEAAEGAPEDLCQIFLMRSDALVPVVDFLGRDAAMELMKRSFSREHHETAFGKPRQRVIHVDVDAASAG